MWYSWSPKTNRCYEFETEEALKDRIKLHNDLEITREDAFLKLFHRISKSMTRKFGNYSQLELGGEVYIIMLSRFREKGTFAPDKPFLDNEKMWWSFAKKTCFYIIRKNKKKLNTVSYDALDIQDDYKWFLVDEDKSDNVSGIDATKAICKFLNKLLYSEVNSEYQMGLFAACKLKGLSDKETCEIMQVGIARIREIKRQLKESINLRFGECL